MVNTLQFNMSVPTPYVFMRRFLKASQSDKKVCRHIILEYYYSAGNFFLLLFMKWF